VDCSWGVLENYRQLSKDYLAKVCALREKYHPIELDHKLSVQEKIPHMVEWYTQARPTTNLLYSPLHNCVFKFV
jgi:hypothetical protein